MADVKSYPPRRKNWRIELGYKDVARLIVEGCEEPETVSFLSTPELELILHNLNAEHQFRQTKGEENEPQ